MSCCARNSLARLIGGVNIVVVKYRARSVEAPGPLAADREHFSAETSTVRPDQPHVSNLVSISAPPIYSPEPEKAPAQHTSPEPPEADVDARPHSARAGGHVAQSTPELPPDSGHAS